MKPDHQITIGHFSIGWHAVDLVLRPGDGGEFYAIPEPGKPSRIKVGSYDGKQDWGKCLTVLMHEAWEFAMFAADLRYTADNRMAHNSAADHLFVMTHEQFHACCAKVSEFMVQAVPALSEAFNKWHGPTKKKGKKR